MTPEEIYDRLQNALTLLQSIRRRDIFTKREQDLLWICFDNMNEIKDLLVSRLPPTISEDD